MAALSNNPPSDGGKWLLAVDTSAPGGGVALLSPASGDIHMKMLPEKVRTSRILLPEIENLMTEARVPKESILAVAAAIGPGSFTGLRIGLLTLKGLSMGWGCPLYGVSSFDALAETALSGWLAEGREAPGWILTCRDARHDEVFSALFKPEDQNEKMSVLRIEEDRVGPFGEIPLPGMGDILIVLGKNDRPADIPESANRAGVIYWDLSAAPQGVARLAWREMSEGRTAAPPGLEPIYGRRPRAETMWE